MGRYDNKVKKTGMASQSTSSRIGCSGCFLSCSYRCTSECTGGVMKMPMRSEKSTK